MTNERPSGRKVHTDFIQGWGGLNAADQLHRCVENLQLKGYTTQPNGSNRGTCHFRTQSKRHDIESGIENFVVPRESDIVRESVPMLSAVN